VPADPYRTTLPIAAPRRKARPIDTTPLSTLPLGIIAITLFLPVTHDCNNHLESPLDAASESLTTSMWIVPMFVGAAALCASIAYAFWKRSSSTFMATAIIGAHVVTMAVMAVIGIVDDKGAPWLLVALPALAIFTVAWWRRGWRRLSLLVDAYLVAALPPAGLIVMVADAYGGYLFGFAFALLILFRVAQLVSWLISR